MSISTAVRERHLNCRTKNQEEGFEKKEQGQKLENNCQFSVIGDYPKRYGTGLHFAESFLFYFRLLEIPFRMTANSVTSDLSKISPFIPHPSKSKI